MRRRSLIPSPRRRRAGGPAQAALNSTALRHPHLLALGDVFAVPGRLPVQNVFSIGDVLIVVVAFLALHRICGSRLPGRRRVAAASSVVD